MPTVLRLPGLRVVIYPADHRPAHVHVIGTDGVAVFFLNCPHGPLELREVFGFTLKTTRSIANELTKQVGALCMEWGRIHDDF